MALKFQAKYSGKCASLTCTKEGRINVGDFITWDRKRKGVAYHVDCFEALDSNLVKDSNLETSNFIVDEINEIPMELMTLSSDLKTANENELEQKQMAKELLEVMSKYRPKVQALDEKSVIDIIERWQKIPKVIEVQIFKPEIQERESLGIQHESFPTLLQVLSAKDQNGYSLNCWLVGPAGSGKTTAALMCARALSLSFYFTGAMDNQYGLSGFIDAHGKLVRTPFRECYEHGGIFLWDEVDACGPNALLWANAALANGNCAFPDAIVPRHKDCIIVAAANTWGLGATNDYVGRMKQDAAFMDRFVQLEWSYDEAMERALCSNAGWVSRVQAIRKAVKAKGLKVVISPRSSYYGEALLKTGLSIEQVEKMTLRKAMTDDQWNTVRSAR